MFSSRETLYRTRAHLNVDGYVEGIDFFGDFGTDVFATHAMKDVRKEDDVSIFFGTITSTDRELAAIKAKGRISLVDGELRALFWWSQIDQAKSFTIERTSITCYPQTFTFDNPVNAFEVVSHKNRTDISFGNTCFTGAGVQFTPVELCNQIPETRKEEVADALTASHADIFITGKVLKIIEGTIGIERM